jgi:acetyl-CoA carboxylase biotin carboxyl carrier protein
MVEKSQNDKGLNLDKIKKLIEMLEKSSLEEIEVSYKDTHLKLKKPQSVHPVIHTSPVVPAVSVLEGESGQKNSGMAKMEEKKPEIKSTGFEVKSPMVGTFYRSPAPNAEPFVKVGDIVKKGQTLCIIEAMKLMNEIESEVDGKVLEIRVQNADPVEYGETIMIIDTGI